MHELTLRGFDRDLERRLRQVARSRGLSLDEAARYLLRKGAGLESAPCADVVGSLIDHLIGTWTAEDEAEFRAATRAFELIDPAAW
jgi:hypothetical protein